MQTADFIPFLSGHVTKIRYQRTDRIFQNKK